MNDFNKFTGLALSDCFDNHVALVNFCNFKRKTLPSSPTQSNFRVYCLLIVKTITGDLTLLEGTNGEQGYIGGAICAERSALLKLRFLDNPEILVVVVTTDSDHPLSPGALCREYLMSSANLSTTVVMGNHDGSVVTSTTLETLYPYAYLYRTWTRPFIMDKAKAYCEVIKQSPRDSSNAIIFRLFEAAMNCNDKDANDILHPIRFSAAVLFPDDSIQSAWQLKGLEYGCTLDPVSQLLHSMEVYRSTHDAESGLPSYLMMVDQLGVCHAPFAQARALLTELGYGTIKCIIHDEEGKLHLVEANELMPQVNSSSLLSKSDFH